ncbi:MAG TPA: hypothetical protein PK339_12550 [Flavitalea sp.]|nr:hypothetical protein [Flavitalea sp.]
MLHRIKIAFFVVIVVLTMIAPMFLLGMLSYLLLGKDFFNRQAEFLIILIDDFSSKQNSEQ